jgi:hypothetical protein
MVKRIALFIILAGGAFMVWENRHHFSELAGLESNRIRIEGDWYPVYTRIKEADCYTFFDRMIELNGEAHGQYLFTSNDTVQITMGGNSAREYHVEFPTDETMIWYQTVRGELKPAFRWAR